MNVFTDKHCAWLVAKMNANFMNGQCKSWHRYNIKEAEKYRRWDSSPGIISTYRAGMEPIQLYTRNKVYGSSTKGRPFELRLESTLVILKDTKPLGRFLGNICLVCLALD